MVKMIKIGRGRYHQAMERIFRKVGYSFQVLSLGKILINKQGRKIYVLIAGKKLPYDTIYGEGFPWETHMRPETLKMFENEARQYGAESWIAFCYAILNDKYKDDFSVIVTLDGIEYGTRMIKTSDFWKSAQRRSLSWRKVDLPREKVVQITHNPEEI